MIADLILQVGKISLPVSLLIVILLALSPLLQKRYRARWRYFAWLVIALRLLVPVNFTLSQAPIRIELPAQHTVAAVTPPSEEHLQVDWVAAITPAADINNSPVDIEPTNAIVVDPLTIAGGVWLAGVLGFLLFQIVSYQVFLRKLKTSQMQETPRQVKEAVWQIGVDMGICRLPEAVVTDAIDAPVLIGVLRPRVLLPHTNYSSEQIAFVLRHELVHYRRRDMWYKLVLLLANAVHWFNPLVYLMTVQATKDIELACDDDVACGLDPDARARYGDTILSALPRKRRLEPLFSTRFGSAKKNMKDRLRNLFDMAAKRRGIAALCAVVACALTLTGFVTFGYAAAKPNSLSTVNENSPANLSIQRLGQHSLNSGDILKANLSWNGKGTVMLLYTDRDYNDDEILAPLQGIPGLPKPNYDNVDHDKPRSGAFNFTSSPTSPLAQEQKVAESGSYHIYIVRYGFDGINQLTGNVSRVDTNGIAHIIWPQTATTANDTIDEITTLTGSNNVTVKSIGAGEVACIGKIELGPDSAYTATLSIESGSGAMIALHDSPSVTKHMGTTWNQLFSGTNNNIYFSSEQPKTAYVYVGSQAIIGGTKLTNVKVNLVQTKFPVSPDGDPYFQIKSNGKSILHSGSFEAKAGQTLTITATSNIKGGTVDFFLFSPAGNGLNEVTSFTFGGSNATKTVELSAGRWAYNCTGFFDSGDIVITGTIGDSSSVGAQSSQAGKSDTEKYDVEAIRIIDESGTWNDSINRLFPYMSPEGVEKVVNIYLERHLFPNITPPEAARQVASIIEPALKYMTKEAGESANRKIAAYY